MVMNSFRERIMKKILLIGAICFLAPLAVVAKTPPPIQANFKVELGKNMEKFPKSSYVELSAEDTANSKLFVYPSEHGKFKTFKGITYTGLPDRPYHVSPYVRNPNCVAKVSPTDTENGKSYVVIISNYVPAAAGKKATCDIHIEEAKAD
jgi:hypothetical protein